MTQEQQQHPMIPPQELVQQWEEDWHHSKIKHIELEPYIAAQAAQYGADQELEACLDEVSFLNSQTLADLVRKRRRPKPPSLKEKALEELDAAILRGDCFSTSTAKDIIRRALEQLPDQ